MSRSARGSRDWLDLSPRLRIEAQCNSRGQDAVVSGCIELLHGRDVDPGLVLALGGRPALWLLDGGAGGPDYWKRVWAARGLLWAFDQRAAPALLVALDDQAWRVREMAAKVVARHLVGEALPAVARLRDDPVPRVGAAAERAVVLLTAAGA